MEWKDAKSRSRRLARQLRELGMGEAVQSSKLVAYEVASRTRTTTEKAFNSDLVGKAREATGQSARRLKDLSSDASDWGKSKWLRATEETHEKNWYLRAARACEEVSDAVLGNSEGVSSRISRGVAAKLGAAGTSAGIFSVASLLGTASTGTAIGTLSGAAFTGASLAWIGGSVLAGTVILGVASVAGGIGAAAGAAWISRKFLYGDKREITELESQERRIVDSCLALAIAFRKQSEAGSPVDTVSARYLHDEALKPLSQELVELQNKVAEWPAMARRRLKLSRQRLQQFVVLLGHWSSQRPNFTTGVVSAVFLQLLAEDLSDFSPDQLLVLDALRRSNQNLANASEEELSIYVQALDPIQLQGLQNNVKGIYHELRYVDNENNDGDFYVAELFEATNHPGADVRITNIETGAVQEIQLKATDYLNHIKQHNERFESIEVFATSEIADSAVELQSSGLSNKKLGEDVETMIGDLDNYYEPNMSDSMGAAAMVALARNVRVMLQGRVMTIEERRQLVQGGAISAGTAGLFSLILS
ncbi:hypothetical protein FMN52_00980 [Marinobacter sp. BW6]|uniref:hypothetical protein n=1 Tax=Marinobacter sp. BW6 TaxID=2592624 RepID=UPI0011DEFC77|nr:hypothetical protein [Marinobacter sp. BW6]TYC63829.1 hypothetical protein FMN52_00980 [Marinobacter sp. BW6]